MATYFDGSGKIWLTLRGFDWNWTDLVGCGRSYVWISKLDFVGYGGIQRDYRRIWMGFSLIQVDLVGFSSIQLHLDGFSCIQADLAGFSWIQLDLVGFRRIQKDSDIKFPSIWYGMYVWYVWYGMVWYGKYA